MGAPRRPPSGRPRRVGACRAPPAPGLGAGPGRAGRGRCPPPEPPRRGGTQRDQLGGWVVAAGAVPPPPRSGAVPAAPNCGNGAGGRRPHPFIPPPPLGTGTAAPRFPSDPVPVGRREGRAPGLGGAEPPRPSAAPHCPPRPPGRVCSSPPSPWCHPGGTVGCGGGCRVSVWLHVPPPLLYPSLSVALGAAFTPSLGVSPSPPHAAPPHPGGTAGLREPPLPLVQSWRCACMHASAPAVPHTRVCKSARPRARSWQHGAAVQRCTGGGGPLLCPIVELWGGL